MPADVPETDVDLPDETGEAVPPPATHDPEAPEADAIEQAQPATPAPPPKVAVRPDVPEADALEQAEEVPEGDDEIRDL